MTDAVSAGLQSRHISGLDGIRALAVIIVMVSHGGFGNVVPGGFGVTLFFFLSGYLITTLLRREWSETGRVELKAFYIRRVVRIFPPMYIAIFLTCLLGLIGLQPTQIAYEKLVWDFLFLSNYAPQFDSSSRIAIPLWSLDVEEHFYLLFPLTFIILAKKTTTARIAIACALVCACILLVRIGHAISLSDLGEIYYWTHTRIDSVLFGCILALWNNPVLDEKDYFDRPVWIYLVGVGFCLIAFVIRDPFFRETIRYSLQGLGLLLIFNRVVRKKGWIAAALNSLPLRWIALLSYTLYLIHKPIFDALHFSYPFLPGYALLPIGSILAVIVSFLVYYYVEKPLSAWRRRYENRGPKRASGPEKVFPS